MSVCLCVSFDFVRLLWKMYLYRGSECCSSWMPWVQLGFPVCGWVAVTVRGCVSIYKGLFCDNVVRGCAWASCDLWALR